MWRSTPQNGIKKTNEEADTSKVRKCHQRPGKTREEKRPRKRTGVHESTKTKMSRSQKNGEKAKAGTEKSKGMLGTS